MVKRIEVRATLAGGNDIDGHNWVRKKDVEVYESYDFNKNVGTLSVSAHS